MISTLKVPFISSLICSLLVFPLIAISLVFYNIFSNTSENKIFFNSISIKVLDSGFTFSLSPSFFLLMGIVFVGTFLITFAIQKLIIKK